MSPWQRLTEWLACNAATVAQELFEKSAKVATPLTEYDVRVQVKPDRNYRKARSHSSLDHISGWYGSMSDTGCPMWF